MFQKVIVESMNQNISFYESKFKTIYYIIENIIFVYETNFLIPTIKQKKRKLVFISLYKKMNDIDFIFILILFYVYLE